MLKQMLISIRQIYRLVLTEPVVHLNPKQAEFLKRTCPALDAEESMDSFMDVRVKL